MNTLTIALVGLGLTKASGDLVMRRLESQETLWDADLYFLTPGGVGTGACEEGFEHQIFNEQECLFAVEDLGYEIKSHSTVIGLDKVCGCALNPETGHVQFNEFSHPTLCYSVPFATNAQEQNSEDAGLVPICFKKGPVEFAPIVNFDNYYFNPAGIGSGRCEAGFDSMLENVKECEFAIKSLGYEINSVSEDYSWGKVCGCSYNAETKTMQFNRFMDPKYCFDAPSHQQVQDSNSREQRLVAVCYKKPELDASFEVSRGNSYFNTMGVGSGRCEAGFKHQIFNLHDCAKAIVSLEDSNKIRSMDTVNAWDKVCGCSYNPETGHVQFNRFASAEYCYNDSAHLDEQDMDSRLNRLIAVCHHYDTEEPTSSPTAEPTAMPIVFPENE